jgi:CheY-like chemotaxis protein
MADRSTFISHVREVFDHLDDPAYLGSHPLAGLLGIHDRRAAAGALRRTLLGAVDELRPADGTPLDSSAWRRWRCLVMRYVDGAGIPQIARQLQLSERQARRDHAAGVDAVAAVLWSWHGSPPDAPALGVGLTATASASAPADSLGAQDLEAESARMAATSRGQSTNVATVLESALATVGPFAEERHGRIEVTLGDGLRQVSPSEPVLRQTLLCLSMWALMEGEASVTQFVAENAGAHVRISISFGMPTSGAVVSPRSDEARDLIETARRLVEPVGASIDVENSDPGRIVTLLLPTADQTTVLVVDDNPDIVQLFRRYLYNTDYNLVQARTPSTALELARALHPAVITLDAMMPSQDGWQILQQLRLDPSTRDIPVIICSVLPERALATSLGVTEFLAKPVTQRSLLAALRGCLAGRAPTATPGSPEDSAPFPPPRDHPLS